MSVPSNTAGVGGTGGREHDMPSAPGLSGVFNRKSFDRLVFKARAAALWEQVYPATIAPLNVGLLFLSVSWFGVWGVLPAGGRMAGVAIFAALLGAAMTPLRNVRMPTRRDALDRIDQASGLPHNPARTLDDHLSTAQEGNPLAKALWDNHIEMIAQKGGLHHGKASPDTSSYPSAAWRAPVALALFVAFAQANGDVLSPLAKAFDWQDPPPVTEMAVPKVDAWVTPPSYTQDAPLFLTAPKTEAETNDNHASVRSFTTTEGGVLTIRVSGGDAKVAVNEGVGAFEVIETEATRTREAFTEYRLKLNEDVNVSVMATQGYARHWHFAVTPDLPPEIAIAGDPQYGEDGKVILPFTIRDDHAGADGEALFRQPEQKPPPIPARKPPRP